MNNKLLYLYCVTDCGEEENFNASGINGGDIEVLEFKDLKVWFSGTDEIDTKCSLENLKIHNRVSLKLMENHTVIPFKYGTVVKDKDEAYSLMDKLYPRINENIGRLSGKCEMGIKVFGEIKNEAVLDYGKLEGVKRLAAIKTKLDSRDYLMEKIRLYESEKAKGQELNTLKDILFKEILPLSAENKILNVNKNKLLINSSFLIKKNNIAKFEGEFDSIKVNNPEYSFLFSGPWPPYNFINISLGGD